ncbi:MAG: hypothetical protein ACRDON_09720 [Gaiellaceae bacterium]
MTAVTALAVGLLVTGNALADTRRISDGNDRPGPLDIRSASHGHAGTRVVHTISTFSTWSIGLLGLSTPNLFALEISTDADPALERVVLVFSANGRMVANVFRLPGGSFIGSATASRPNARTVRVSILRSRLGNPVGYRWNATSQYQAVGTCSRVCIDRAPNFGRVLHDITAPAVGLTSFPVIPPDIDYDVSFQVSDKGGAGLRRWTLQHRELGTAPWTQVATGTTGGLKSPHYISAEDTDDQFRVVVVDRHGNVRVSPIRLVSVPLDDPALTYSPGWNAGAGMSTDFRVTRHASATVLDTATHTFTGRYFAWVAPGGGDGMASVLTEDGLTDVILAGFAGPRRIVFEHTFASVAMHSITITVTGGTVPIDGIIVR